MKLKKLPIGISDFKRIIEDDMFYVDKSLLLKEILDSGTLVSLIVRPRRFGKTTNLSMLRYFFEKHPNIESSKHLFANLELWKEGDEYMDHCGKYPVVFLTFKDVKETNWEACHAHLKIVISREYKRHSYLLDSKELTDFERRKVKTIIEENASNIDFQTSLKNLTEYLYNYHKARVILLIDEYDTPIHEAFYKGYYTDIVDFMRSFLGAGLKDNSYIEKGVVTGILRISKESIFSDLNNFFVFTILNNKYSDKFGLTEKEVFQVLDDYGLVSYKDDVKEWYDGYVFGDTKDMYNPWSVINFVETYQEGLKPHWVNTSSNLLIKKLLTNAGSDSKRDMELLLTGQPIYKEVVIDTVFSEIEKNSETLWSFLLFGGYLKVTKQEMTVNDTLICELTIPNKEVRFVYRKFISSWLTDNLQSNELNTMLQSLIHGSVETFDEIFQKFVMNSMSYFDPIGNEPEKVYHAFVLGLLLQLSDTYSVKSNRESGYGRYDIMLIPKKISDNGIVIEFKKVSHYQKETLQTAAETALLQIKEKQYEAELRSMGITTIYKYAVAFDGKEVLVMKG
jgi:hypothetical protein